MYKIFFNDRLLILSDSWDACLSDSNAICYKVTKKIEIAGLVNYFLENSQLRSFYLVSEDTTILFEEIKRLFDQLDAAGGLVQNASNDVLMIYRNGRWDLPKGRCEIGESIEETALREVEEECGITGLQLYNPITDTYHLYRDMYCKEEKFVLKYTHWYLMKYTGSMIPIPQTIEGIERAEWIAQSKLPAILPTVYNSISEVFYMAGLSAL